ncbi:hypothetical protein TNCV_4624251 [Trichonephila clavipes]|nr:hypothetical protein TNCV_4624251 [Trichonephila clavipes]
MKPLIFEYFPDQLYPLESRLDGVVGLSLVFYAQGCGFARQSSGDSLYGGNWVSKLREAIGIPPIGCRTKERYQLPGSAMLWNEAQCPNGSVLCFHDPGPVLKPRAEQGRLGLSSLQWINKRESCLLGN